MSVGTGEITTRLAAALDAASLCLPGQEGDARECFGDRPLVQPGSEEELATFLRLASSEGWCVLPSGLGSKLEWRPVSGDARVDVVLSTRRLAGVVAFEPGDGTLTAQAGCTLAELQTLVAGDSLSLTPAVPTPSRATLGGVLAAGQSGIDRERYGPSRHHVLGMRVALADGTLARTGGRLVKNVTGFDLQRLYCGSHGTLCVITEATLRLFPAPATTVVHKASFDTLVEALDAARDLRALALQPFSLLVEHDDVGAPRTTLHVVLSGREEVVAWESEQVLNTLPESQTARDDEALAHSKALQDGGLLDGRWPDRTGTCRPSEVAALAARWAGSAKRLRIQPGVAQIEAWWSGNAPDDRSSATPSPVALRTMEALRARLDPERLFAPRALT